MEKIALTKEEELLYLMRTIHSFIHKTEKARKLVHKSQRNTLQKARSILSDMNEKEKRTLRKISEELKRHEDVLQKILKVNENVDETLCNVLIAIKQNEYLQAWYPPQDGSPAQKVTGKYVTIDKHGKNKVL